MGIEDKEKKPYQPTEEEVEKAEGMVPDEYKERDKDREEAFNAGQEEGRKLEKSDMERYAEIKKMRGRYETKMGELWKPDRDEYTETQLGFIPEFKALGDEEKIDSILEDALYFYWHNPNIMRRGAAEECLIKVFDEAGRLDKLVDRVKNDLDTFDAKKRRNYSNVSWALTIPLSSGIAAVKDGYDEIVKAVEKYKEDIQKK